MTIGNALRVALRIVQGKIILNFGVQKRLRAFLYPIFTGGVWERTPSVKTCGFASSLGEGAFGMAVQFPAQMQSLRACPLPLGDGLRHPAFASCLGRHSRLAGRCPNNCSLFPPLAAVAVVALRGGWSPEVGRGESEHPSLPLAQRSVPARLRQAITFPAECGAFQILPTQNGCCTFLCSSRFIVFILRPFSAYPVPASARCSRW